MDGYLWLLASAFLAATVPPFSSEAVLTALAALPGTGKAARYAVELFAARGVFGS